MNRFLALASTATLAAIALTLRINPLQSSLAQSSSIPDASMEVAADERVAQTLEALDLVYTVEENGTYRLQLDFENGRSQIGWISSETKTIGSLELRQIFSPGHYVDGNLSAQMVTRLLQDNADEKLGAWQLIQDDDQAIALFAARMDTNSSADEFMAALVTVLKVADEMEQELSGSDRF